MRLLLLEDDAILGEGLRDFLQTDGHRVDWCKRLCEAKALTGEPYDALLVDWQLPDGSGLDWVRSIRRQGISTPVVIMTARDLLSDRVRGLDGGADDYLVKPFDLQELTARCDAVIRRRQGRAAPVIVHGDLSYAPAARQVMCGGAPVALSARELAVLDVLLSNIGHVISKAQIEERLYRWDEAIESNTIEVHVSHLRRKLGAERIKTIRGLGYIVPPAP